MLKGRNYYYLFAGVQKLHNSEVSSTFGRYFDLAFDCLWRGHKHLAVSYLEENC